ncbi:hypothetical protein ES705_25489 [subsurface metagenome]
MTEEFTPEQKLELAGATPTKEGKVVFENCHLAVKDGHIVAECDTMEASQELALLLMEEVFIRVKPSIKPKLEPEPEPEPKE